jgi:VanZ family protein
VINLKNVDFRYLSRRWLMVYGYVLFILVATPYLPSLIQWASSKWPGASVSGFVLGVEISMGILLILLAGGVFFYNRQKFLYFLLITGGSILAVFLFYRIVPNPYELTHLPEYGILSVLTMEALKGGEGASREKADGIDARSHVGLEPEKGVTTFNSLYLRSAVFTTALGTADELYQGLLPSRSLIWYDVLLNGLGGVLGLAILWGISKK